MGRNRNIRMCYNSMGYFYATTSKSLFFAVMCCFLPLNRSTLIQDIQHGNRGCESTQDGAYKSHLLLAVVKEKKFASHAMNDEREIENRECEEDASLSSDGTKASLKVDYAHSVCKLLSSLL